MDEKKTSKIQDLKETASVAAEIMHQIATPGVLESLNKVKETTIKVNEIIKGLQTPEMMKNLENFRLISENMNEASINMKDTMQQLKETGAIHETTEIIKLAKEKINSFSTDGEDGITGHDIREVSVTTKEMLVSIKDLMNELTLTVVSSKQSETIDNIKNTAAEVSNLYKMKVAQAD
ncbi:MAG: hypothetical protein ACR2LL_03400 [Nitrosopumilus sp.]|uniref:hypothetical protein n=1 Tax=Nitrosopumilus sp. TaxID=2024843 RepID=UPI002931BDC8|nr:hypothetical protein [Nitrosopumilus sp.]